MKSYFLLFPLLCLTDGARLSVTPCKATLPWKPRHTAGAFNGKNSIFLFGGHLDNGSFIDSILEYDIFTDQIIQVGSLHEKNAYQACILMQDGNITCLGGLALSFPPKKAVLKFSPISYNLSEIGLWERPSESPCLVILQNQEILSIGDRFGGDNLQGIFRFDPQTQISNYTERVFEKPIMYSCAPVLFNNEIHFLHNRAESLGSRLEYFVINPSTYSYRRVNMTFNAQNPPISGFVKGESIFAISSLRLDNELLQAIVEIRPLENTFKWHGIDGLRPCYYFDCEDAAIVYVAGQMRIYIFGGVLSDGKTTDLIRYIDLAPIWDPPTTPTTEPSTTSTPSSGKRLEGRYFLCLVFAIIFRTCY